MNIDISRKEYKLLLNLIGMAEEVFATLELDDSKTRKYDELFQKIYSMAEAIGCSDLVETDDECGGYCSTAKVSEPVDMMLEYDTETFWRELTERLSDRDLRRKYGAIKYENMLGEEVEDERLGLCNQYAEEFTSHGVERVEVVAHSADEDPVPRLSSDRPTPRR